MINIIHVIGHIGRGGDTTVVMEVMKHMDQSIYHFDFITHRGADLKCVENLRKNGCNVYIMDGDVRQLGLIKYYKEIKKLIEELPINYDAIHTHTSMQSGVALKAAKACGIKNRICHSHVTAIQRKASALLKFLSVPIFRSLYMNNSTHKVACSKMAGDFLFGRNGNYALIYNAVDIDKYLDITEKETTEIRNEFGIDDDDILIGHVGRMSEMKNQKFDIVLAEHTKDDPSIKYILVGDGVDIEKIKKSASSLSDTVIITGQRNDVPAIMKSCDCVILPSLPGEGFPVTMIEAQAAGCKCIVSDTVTPEVETGLGLVDIIPVDKTDEWVNAMRNIKRNKDIEYRNKCALQLSEKGFGKEVFVSKWLELYDV